MENFVPLTPVGFFQLKIPCYYLKPGFPQLAGSTIRKHKLPDTSQLCHEEGFADISTGWNLDGFEIRADISQPFRKSSFPSIAQGDSIEIFIDTRDVKTAGFNTRFCHHFYFLPEETEGHLAGEITKFRTEDAHDLCNPADLKVISLFKKNGYSLQIFIPALCLFGYDPEQFNRLGFAYRINRAQGLPQHFCVVSDEYQIDQQPSLWSSLILSK